MVEKELYISGSAIPFFCPCVVRPVFIHLWERKEDSRVPQCHCYAHRHKGPVWTQCTVVYTNIRKRLGVKRDSAVQGRPDQLGFVLVCCLGNRKGSVCSAGKDTVECLQIRSNLKSTCIPVVLQKDVMVSYFGEFIINCTEKCQAATITVTQCWNSKIHEFQH